MPAGIEYTGTVPERYQWRSKEVLAVAGEFRKGMLGTLRSELDEGDSELHEDFETLSVLVSAARAAYMDFRLSPERAAALFKMLRLPGEDGQEWTIGPTTGSWFRRPPGSADWIRSATPLGVTPSYSDSSPEWLTEGIGAYLVAAEPGGAGPDSAATAFTSGIINPFAHVVPEVTVAADGAVVLPKPVKSEEDDLAWLDEEWGSFDKDLEKLRDIRQREGAAAPAAPELPTNLPPDWDADRALSTATTEGSPIAARAGSEAEDPNWVPPERGDFVSPETFFLPPEARES